MITVIHVERVIYGGSFLTATLTLLNWSDGGEPWNWRLNGIETRFNGHPNDRHSVQSTKGEWSVDPYKPGEWFSTLPIWPLHVQNQWY